MLKQLSIPLDLPDVQVVKIKRKKLGRLHYPG
jgi:hypothetical protein